MKRLKPVKLGIQVIEGEALPPVAPAPPVPAELQARYAATEVTAAAKNLLLETCLANDRVVCFRLYDEVALNGTIAPMFGADLDVVDELIADYDPEDRARWL